MQFTWINVSFADSRIRVLLVFAHQHRRRLLSFRLILPGRSQQQKARMMMSAPELCGEEAASHEEGRAEEKGSVQTVQASGVVSTNDGRAYTAAILPGVTETEDHGNPI